ncbi:MAG: bile acid:sodium symporter [Bacteroidota bacterium]|nr:bile acid:sodium symporter [Bacteroidota bacterium]
MIQDLIFNNIDFLIDIVLAFITMSLGLNLTRSDFNKLFLNPKSLTIGLIAQMILLPLLAFILISFSDFSPATKVGFVIISLCPGGVTSNLVSFLLKGNIALSISLTVINGLLCMVTIPILTNLALYYFFHQSSDINLPVLSTISHIALVTLIPAIIGVFIRGRLPDIAKKIIPILKYLLPSLLLIVFMVKIFAPEDKGGVMLTQLELVSQGYWVLSLNFLSMLLGYFLSTFFHVEFRNKITIIVEVGLQNTALALLVSGNILKNIEMQKPAMVYAILTFLSTLIFGWMIKKVALTFKKTKL